MSESPWRRRLRVFRGDRLSMVSLALLLLVGAFSMSAEFWSNSRPLVMSYQGHLYFPVLKDYHGVDLGQEDLTINYRKLDLANGWAWWPLNVWDPFESNTQVASFPSGPTPQNWLGTDDRGRDVFARLLYGYRFSMGYAILVWVLATAVGTVLGGIMGYRGAWVDFLGQRIVEIWSTVPVIFLLIMLVSIFQPSVLFLAALTTIFEWMGISYYVRGEFLRLRRMEFVEAARAQGARVPRIILTHIFPNALTPIITFSPFIIAGHIYGLAGLDYLGFGLPPPTPSWGELLRQAHKNFTSAWWLAAYPSLALFLTLLLLANVGQGVRRAFDPKASN
jgi:microcin C transport system permease protein